MPIVETVYNARTEIFLYNHVVEKPYRFLSSGSYVVTENGRKIVKAGTVIPANDATAEGICHYDVDVTDGDASGAIVIHGFIKEGSMPTAPAAAAKSALPLVFFQATA